MRNCVSSLRQFLEKTIEQDKKLNETLRKFARKAKTRDTIYEHLCAHMQQIASREVVLEELLASLNLSEGGQSSPSASTLPIISRLKEKRRSQQRSVPAADSHPSRVLNEFEKVLVYTYNQEPERWSRKYRPVSFGAANVDEIWRSGGAPKFTVKEGGIYHLVAESGRFYVVPEPGLKLQESYFRSEGIGELFHCPGLESGASLTLVSPAVVEESGERWIVVEKGELRGRG